MPREFGISGKWRRYRQPPTFVGVMVLRCGADRERRHLIEKKIQAVIVINDDDQIRLHFIQPRMHRFVAVEKRFPIWSVLPSASDGFADRWNVGCGDTADHLGHV